MIESNKSNTFAFFIGLLAFILVLIVNLLINSIETSIIRAVIAFVSFFILGILLHKFVHINFNLLTKKEENKGKHINISSDQKEDIKLNEIYQTNNEEKLEPLEFEKLEIKENS